jgi:hypothetical protein
MPPGKDKQKKSKAQQGKQVNPHQYTTPTRAGAVTRGATKSPTPGTSVLIPVPPTSAPVTVPPVTMSTMGMMPHMEPFDPEGNPANLAQRWEKYLERFDRTMNAYGITEDSRKRDCLLIFIGVKTERIYDNIKASLTGTTYKIVSEGFTAHFSPQKNVTTLRYQFNMSVQKEGETLDTYCSRLRTLIRDCKHADEDDVLVHHMIATCLSYPLKVKAIELAEADLTLAKFLEIGRRREHAQREAKFMEAGATVVSRDPDAVNWTEQGAKPKHKTWPKKATYI